MRSSVNLNYISGKGVMNQSVTIKTMEVSFPKTPFPIGFSMFPLDNATANFSRVERTTPDV